ncbi:MAG: hypothetical protein IPP66_11785 [Anaerolineales bacterium]|nr:hypothetical protein [Anaerolineales bacterium]
MLPSTLLDVFYEKILGFGKSKFWFLFPSLVFLFVVLINGVGIVLEAPYQRLSENPFITRTDIHFNNYWQENPLLPIIAFYLRQTSSLTFNILCFVIIFGAYALFTGLTARHWGSTQSLIFSTLLITSPLTTIFLCWLGTPDGLTVLLTIPFLFLRSSPLAFCLAFLGMVNHPTFAIAIIEILTLRALRHSGIGTKHFIATAIGIILGYGFIKFFLEINAIDIFSRFDFMQLKSLDEWVKMNIRNLPMSLLSLFSIHWLIFATCMVMFFKRNKRFYSLALLMLVVNYGIVFFTLDTTRVFILISWGILFECIFYSYELTADNENQMIARKQFLQALILIGVISFVTPRYFSWAGEIHTTPFYEFIRHLTRLL